MTNVEKSNIAFEASQFEAVGDHQKALEVAKKLPMSPAIAKIWKKHIGLESLKQSGWNFSEVEASFGKDWFTR
jgi:hypothetical protein